jgi:outer membrane protein assembly factor BamB
MRNASRWIAAVAAGVILVGATSVLAQDWPQWRGPNRDNKAAGFTAPAEWPKELTQKWKVEVGPGDATPALVGDKIYVFTRLGADEVTTCLEAETGKKVWEDKTPAMAVTGAAARHPGPRGSPAVADGMVVTEGVGGVVSCLNAADGKVVWRKDPFPKMVPQFFEASSPLTVDKMAIAHVGGSSGAIIAFDLATGDEKWKCENQPASYSSPVVATIEGAKMIVQMTDKDIVGLGAADGKLLWQIPLAAGGGMGGGMGAGKGGGMGKGKGGMSGGMGGGYKAATVIVEGSTVYYCGQGFGTKAAAISKDGDKFAAKELWSNADGPQFSSPVLKDGFLYCLSGQGNLYCINAKDGKTVWKDTTNQGNYGAPVDAGTCMVVLTEKGELIVFRPSDKEYSEVAKFKVASAAYATPVLSGNRIFIKDADSVILFTVAK